MKLASHAGIATDFVGIERTPEVTLTESLGVE